MIPKPYNLKPRHSACPERSRRGFTLIEMLVVITIIGILAGTSISFFYSAKNKKSAETVANEIAVKMAEAHSDAMSPSDNATGLTSIRIRYDATSKIITKEYMNGGNPFKSEDLYTVPNNVTPDPFPNFKFLANSGVTMGNIELGGNKTFTVISKTDPTIIYKVEIDALSGNVEVKKSP